jgi:hypothetical protein
MQVPGAGGPYSGTIACTWHIKSYANDVSCPLRMMTLMTLLKHTTPVGLFVNKNVIFELEVAIYRTQCNYVLCFLLPVTYSPAAEFPVA